ncbi:hypothetical protein BIY26_05975 [Brenneria goodwinii]|uniref:Uncharacterized protein n=2 Tax=Brenneria goodwinii TaxID=1109412 RepID=A0AAE8EQH9_9GAMM|nr:hypothetical protein BIY26_05975 [Brenneria goodwinii]
MGRVEIGETPDIQFLSGVYVSRDTFGMRANAVAAAVRANAKFPFDYPVLGLNFQKDLITYGDRDSVGLYADNTSPPFKPWEKVTNVTYYPVSFTSPELDTSMIKPGMIIDTDHKPKWSTYVVKVSNGKVLTAGWVNSATRRMGTPPSGVGLTINPITKVWATNFNTFLPDGARSKAAVIQENGAINNSIKEPSFVVGIDTVLLPQSKFGGTAAYLARQSDGGNMQRWKYGFVSQGAYANFASHDSARLTPDIGFEESSSAKNGMVFAGKNTESSLLWKDGSRVVASIDPKGLIQKIGYKTIVIKNDTELSDTVGRYIISSLGKVTLTLPPKKNVFDGYTLKLTKTSGKDVTLKSSDGVSINGNTNFTISDASWNKEAIYVGGSWFIE